MSEANQIERPVGRPEEGLRPPMTLVDVLNTLKGHNGYWFRPVSWIGTGKAYTYWHGMTALVPDPEGPKQGMTCNPRELVGEWEITNAMKVCAERPAPSNRN